MMCALMDEAASPEVLLRISLGSSIGVSWICMASRPAPMASGLGVWGWLQRTVSQDGRSETILGAVSSGAPGDV